jgi:hypothetical protein
MNSSHRSPPPGTWVCVAVCMIAFAGSALARTGVPWVTESAERQLIVEWNRDGGDLPLLAEEVVEAVDRPGDSDRSLEVLTTLGDPAFAQLLVDRTVPVESVRELDRNDPEVRILQFVLVTYRTEADTARALESLRRSPRTRSVDPLRAIASTASRVICCLSPRAKTRSPSCGRGTRISTTGRCFPPPSRWRWRRSATRKTSRFLAMPI